MGTFVRISHPTAPNRGGNATAAAADSDGCCCCSNGLHGTPRLVLPCCHAPCVSGGAGLGHKWPRCSSGAAGRAGRCSHPRTCPCGCTAAAPHGGPATREGRQATGYLLRTPSAAATFTIAVRAGGRISSLWHAMFHRWVDARGGNGSLTFATLSATRYFWPRFSSSAITQSVMQGRHSAYRQSTMPRTRSIWEPGRENHNFAGYERS